MTTERTPDRTSPRLHWRKAALTSGAIALLGSLLWLKLVPCTFAKVFHHPCPGCGSTRAVLALASGDFGGLLRYNPLGPVMALFMGVVAVQALSSSLFRGDLSAVGEGRLGVLMKRGAVLVGIAEVLVWAARFFGFLGGPVPV